MRNKNNSKPTILYINIKNINNKQDQTHGQEQVSNVKAKPTVKYFAVLCYMVGRNLQAHACLFLQVTCYQLKCVLRASNNAFFDKVFFLILYITQGTTLGIHYCLENGTSLGDLLLWRKSNVNGFFKDFLESFPGFGTTFLLK